MHHATSLITTIVGGFVLAFILGLLANRLRISPIVGYLAAGLIASPFTPGYVADTDLAPQLAELGVILLMFGVGLHFSLKDLIAVKAIAIPGAIVQITIATLLGLALSQGLGWSLMAGIIFGLCLSTASTVVLLRALEERQLLESQRGQIAIGWLIVEDLAMVLALVLLPALSNALHSDSTHFWSLLQQILITLGKVIAFIIFMVTVGRRVIPWLLAKSAATGSRELFTLAVLAIAMGIALGAVELFDVSFALGAFFAGMMLNESELSHRAAHDTLPLRDAFAVLFFVSVGMLLDPSILIERPFAIFITVAIIIFGKSIAAYAIVRLFRHTKRTALTISASLAQIGEFAYILAALGITLGDLPREAQGLILAGSIISIIFNPLVFSLVERYLNKTESKIEQILDETSTSAVPIPDDICGHAIIVGYGRVGKVMTPYLQQQHIPVVIIDSSLIKIEELRAQHIHAVLGNAVIAEHLQHARIDSARWLLITSPNGYEAGEMVAQARSLRSDLDIFALAQYDDEIEYIMEHGATNVIMGKREVANSMLNLLNLPATPSN